MVGDQSSSQGGFSRLIGMGGEGGGGGFGGIICCTPAGDGCFTPPSFQVKGFGVVVVAGVVVVVVGVVVAMVGISWLVVVVVVLHLLLLHIQPSLVVVAGVP